MNEKINANVCENVQFKQQVKQQLIHWIEISNIWHTIENSDKKLINSCTDVYIYNIFMYIINKPQAFQYMNKNIPLS